MLSFLNCLKKLSINQESEDTLLELLKTFKSSFNYSTLLPIRNLMSECDLYRLNEANESRFLQDMRAKESIAYAEDPEEFDKQYLKINLTKYNEHLDEIRKSFQEHTHTFDEACTELYQEFFKVYENKNFSDISEEHIKVLDILHIFQSNRNKLEELLNLNALNSLDFAELQKQEHDLDFIIGKSYSIQDSPTALTKFYFRKILPEERQECFDRLIKDSVNANPKNQTLNEQIADKIMYDGLLGKEGEEEEDSELTSIFSP